MLSFRRCIGYGEYTKVGVPKHRRIRRQPVDGVLQQALFAHCVVAVHRAPFRPHRQSRMQVVGHHHPQHGPVAFPMLVRSWGIGTTEFWGMGHAHRRAIQKKGAAGVVRWAGLGYQLLKDVVAAYLHERKRQCLPCLIISSRIGGRRLTVFAPVADSFAGSRPEAGGQALQQLQNGNLEGGATVKSLGHEEPEQHQRGVQAVIQLNPSLFLCCFEKLNWEKLAEVRSEPAELGVRRRVEGELKANAFGSS
jgi:hypothetical protein